MHRLRQLGTVTISALGLAWLTRAILDWVLGVEGTALQVAVIAALVIGAAVGVAEARGLEPFDREEQRERSLGWITTIGAIAALLCLALPLPWSPIAALAAIGLTILALRVLPDRVTSASRAASRSAGRPR